MFVYLKIFQLPEHILPEAVCFSFAFLSRANEKKSHLCALCASVVTLQHL